MNQVIVINNQEVAFEVKDGRVFSDSLHLAKVFGKKHKNIIRSIDELPQDDFRELNFEPSFYEVQTGNGTVRKYKMYQMTRDGFALIVMGMTGKEAYEWKKQYIEAFKRLEEHHFTHRYAITNNSTNEMAQAIKVLGEGMQAIAQTLLVLSDKVERIDQRITHLEAAVGSGIAQGYKRLGRRQSSRLVVQAYESRRAAFVESARTVLATSSERLNQSELLRRCGYRRDDKTARKWLGEGDGIYWHIRRDGNMLLYSLIEGRAA